MVLMFWTGRVTGVTRERVICDSGTWVMSWGMVSMIPVTSGTGTGTGPVYGGRVRIRQRIANGYDSCGVAVQRRAIFEDHHAFRPEELQNAVRGGADGVITTQKDACRLNLLKLVYDFDIWYLKIDLEFSEKEAHQALRSLVVN